MMVRGEHAGVRCQAFTAAFSPLSQRFSFKKLQPPKVLSRIMRPEIQTQLDNAKQSIGLLRRHL
jgi:hypothetical protein